MTDVDNITEIMQIEATIADLEKMRDALLVNADKNDILRARCAPIFEQFGDLVQSVGWLQYVPYFNDGDPCTWTINGPGINVRTIDYSVEDEPEGWEGYGEEVDMWSFKYSLIDNADNPDPYYANKRAQYPGFNKQSAEALLEALTPIESWLEGAEGYLNNLFGHAVVVVSADGTVVVEEYDHD